MRYAGCLFVLFIAAAASAAPCTTAAPECTEWIAPGGGPSRTLVYRTYPLGVRNERIVRALVVVHGAGRDGDNYYRHALAAAFLAGALDDTLVVSPRFAANNGTDCRDTLAADEVNWKCNGSDTWRSGGSAADNDRITSYDIADELLRKLADRSVFPNVRAIVLAGHSAGGQFVSRYEMVNQVHDRLGVLVTYVVANPSSYAYPDGQRPTASAIPAGIAAAPPGYQAPLANPAPPPFRAFADSANCTTYDNWPYGFQKRSGYSTRVSDDQMKSQLAARPTTYLLGELDILPLYGFDASCAAMAQGPTRLARGAAWARYVKENYSAKHQMVIVNACGHNGRCMFSSEAALPILFPK